MWQRVYNEVMEDQAYASVKLVKNRMFNQF